MHKQENAHQYEGAEPKLRSETVNNNKRSIFPNLRKDSIRLNYYTPGTINRYFIVKKFGK